MVINTKLFGTIELSEDKILTFDQGLIGFESLKLFAILYDLEKDSKRSVCWLQSLDEPELAFPVIDPFLVKQNYNPEINDNSLSSLGEVKEDYLSVLVTLAVPKDITKMACNLRAPIIINTDTRKGAQVITETAEYPVKYYIYDILKAKKQERGGY